MSATEREKMLAGEPYNSHDPELVQMAIAARRRVAAYGATDPGDPEARFQLLKTIFRDVEPGVSIEPPFFVDYGVHTTIGRDTYINVNFVLIDHALVTIGERCLFAPAVQIATALHPLPVSDRRTPDDEVAAGSATWRSTALPISIGDEVWLGSGVIVMPGVTIGDRSTIGAGSVVTHDVPAGVLALGSPAKVVRHLEGTR